MYADFARRRRNRGPQPVLDPTGMSKVREPTLVGRVVDFFRMAARIGLAFPDVGRGWVLRAARTGRSLQKKYDFDAVITSGPPHSAHFAGLLVSLGNRSMRWIIDMRDPWRGGNKNWLLHGMDPHLIYPLIAPLERILFRPKRMVLVNTREFAEDLQAADAKLSVVHLSNGIDLESLPTRTAERLEGISIAYVGTFYAGRSFSSMLSALRAVARHRPRDADCIKLRIAGQIDPVQREVLRAALDKEGLGSMIEFLGNVPRAEALDLLRRSHLALVLAQQQRTQIPAKLYECVGLGVPTLVISEMNSAASREARRIGALVAEPDDATRIEEILNDLLDRRFPQSVSATAGISYEVLAAQLNQILEDDGAQPRTGVRATYSYDSSDTEHSEVLLSKERV